MTQTPVIYLSRRNLLILLAKLDREAGGEFTTCEIIKYRRPGEFEQSMDSIRIVAVSDEEMYATREAGQMHAKDELSIIGK